MNNKRLVLVIEGPGGVGKDSILYGLIDKYPKIYERFITMTTRPMREGESQGRPYQFVDELTFNTARAKGDVFEFTYRHGNYRGMSKQLIDNVLDTGKIAVGSCDILGMPHLKKAYSKDVVFIFIKADRSEVERRLIKRGDSDQDRQSRLAEYDRYMQLESQYDFSVENNELETAIDDVHAIVQRILKQK